MVNGVPLYPAQNPVNLRSPEHCSRNAVRSEAFAAASRNLILAIELEVMGSIEALHCLVPLQHRSPAPGERSVLIVRVADRPRKRVSDTEGRGSESTRHLTLQ